MSDVDHLHHQCRQKGERKRRNADGTGMMIEVTALARTKSQKREQRKPGTLYRTCGLSRSLKRIVLERAAELVARQAHHHTTITPLKRIFLLLLTLLGRFWCICIRREQKYREKVALKKAQRRAAESAEEKAERKRQAKIDHTAAHFGCVMVGFISSVKCNSAKFGVF